MGALSRREGRKGTGGGALPSVPTAPAPVSDDPALSDVLSQLAVIYRQQQRYAESEEYFRRAVEAAEQNLGPEHPMVALRLNNLAVLYSDQGRYDEAEALYRRTLDIEEKAFGPGHVAVAVGLMNLASLHQKQGRRSDAVAEAGRAESILDARCGSGGRDSDFCRNAIEVHRDLASRLADPRPAGDGGPSGVVAPRAPEPAAAPKSTVPSAGTGVDQASPARVYRAQVVSRRDRQAAARALEKLREAYPTLLAELPARVASADLGERGVWYRIQLGEFANEAAAQALCTSLANRGHEGCWVIATASLDG